MTKGNMNMLDSDKVRDWFALLQEDDSYNLKITSQSDVMLYGNKISGLRYGIYFDNLRGGKVEELTQKLKTSEKKEKDRRIKKEETFGRS